MIESESGGTCGAVPASVVGIVCGLSFLAAVDHRCEYYADGVTSRVASGVSECADLLKPNSLKAGLFFQLARGGVFERFVPVDESSRKSPHSFEGFARPLDEQDLDPVGRAPE